MAKTFKDLQGNMVTIIDYETDVHQDTDIVSGEVSRYVVEVSERLYEVDETTYNAVKTYIKK